VQAPRTGAEGDAGAFRIVRQWLRAVPDARAQWTHFSRSKFGTPPSPSVMAWPLHASMQIFVRISRTLRVEKLDVVAVTAGAAPCRP